MNLDYRQRLLASTLFIGAAALASTPAAAQAQPAEPGSPTDVTQPTGPVEAQPPAPTTTATPVQQGDIIVTGTRIPQATNLESVSPVTVVSSQDVKLSGTTRVEDLLNQLPSASASQSSGVANAATGTAEVDLR